MTDSTNRRRRTTPERHRGAVTLRRDSIPPSTADEKLLDSSNRGEWKTKDAWRALRILAEFVEGFDTLGVIPQSLVDLEVADTASDELIVTTDMGARKNLMIERSDAFITLPGGLGTLDELFEVWTTATLDLHDKPIILLDPDGFYDGLMAWLTQLADTAFVRPAALDRVIVARSIAEALDAIDQHQPGLTS